MFTIAAITFVVAVFVSAFMAWSIGAGSTGSTPFAPAVGANAISTMRAAFVVGIFGFAGAALQGASVAEAVGSDLIGGVTLTAQPVIIVLFVAGALMAFGIYTGYPIATAFTVTGTVVGAGLALGGTPAWGKYSEIAALWIAGPLATAALAYGLASVLPREDVPDVYSIPAVAGFVGAVLANVEFAAPGGPISLSAAAAASWPVAPMATRLVVSLLASVVVAATVYRSMRRDVTAGMYRFLLAMGAVVAFSAGASQVGLAVGPLLPLTDEFSIPTLAVIVGGGVGLLAGSWSGAPRMIKAVAQDYASLGPRRSISALVPAFLLAQIAVRFGVPISFNQIVISAILGAGFAVGGGNGVGARKLLVTLLAWIVSLVVAFGIGYGAVFAIPGL